MTDYRSEARKTARRHGVDPDIFVALVNQESGFNQNARSPAGARGFTQLMPATARGLGVNPDNPRQNLSGGARYLRQQLDKFGGDYKKALAAYNAGPGAVQRYGGIPPFAETQNYVRSILGNKNPRSIHTPATGNRGTGSDGTTSPAVTIGGGTRTVPDPAAQGRVILANLLESRNPNSLLLKLGIVSPDEPTTKTITNPSITVPGKSRSGPSILSGHTASVRGRGVSKITGPNPGRIIPAVRSFMDEISAVRGGKPVVGSDGTGHSLYTVNGNISEHSTGHASDIPARGQELINLGQAALIAAGMPRSQARKQRGGLYNVMKGKRRYQIIFNTQEGGDHTDHLHVGVKG